MGGEPDAVKVAVVGLGRWGPNLARNLNAAPGCELAYCCDLDPVCSNAWRASFPSARFTDEIEELLDDRSLDAVAIATPVGTHGPLAERVLDAGKDCFVEKPLADSVPVAERVNAMAAERDAVLMVGHLLEYHPGVSALARLVHDGELGEIHYVYSQRVNLREPRVGENALWSLGPHDISVIMALTAETPSEVSARGESFLREGIAEVVFAYLRFPSGIAGHMHLSWINPRKERRITVVGSERMATFDDMRLERKVTLYGRGQERDHASYGEYITRSGEVRSPTLPNTEALRIECEHFVACVRERCRPKTDGLSGLRVVRVLEALQSSLERDGVPEALSEVPTANVSR